MVLDRVAGPSESDAVTWVLGLPVLVAGLALHALGARRLAAWAGEARFGVVATLATALVWASVVAVGRGLGALGQVWSLPAVFAVSALVPAAMLLAPRTDARQRVRALGGRGGGALPGWARALVVLTTALVAWATIGTQLWDEPNCHFPVVSALARGVVPAVHPLFPNEPFRYHYAFDVLAALPRALLGLPAHVAIDVATLWCWALLLALAYAGGAQLAGRQGAAWAIVLVPLGSGLGLSWLYRDFYLLQLDSAAIPARWAVSTPPPVISNFFQHPQGLGMSVALAVLLLATERDALGGAPGRTGGPSRRFALAALLLGLGSLAHVVFFAALGLVLGGAVTARAAAALRTARTTGRPRGDVLREAALSLLLLAGALVVARGLGGFFAGGTKTTPADLLVFGRSYFGEPLGLALLHHLFVFGLPLVAAPLAVFARRAPGDGQAGDGEADAGQALRRALLLGVLVGFAVPQLVTYARSWDIVKFFGIGAFFANLLLADVAARHVRRPVLRALVLALATPAALHWLVRMSVMNGVAGIHPMQFPRSPRTGEALYAALDGVIPRDARVLSTNVDVAVGGGFLTPGFEWAEHGDSYMLDRAENERLAALRAEARRTLARPALDGLGVDYVVLSPGDVASLTPEGRAALDDPARFTHLRAVEAGGERRDVYRVVR